MLLGEEQPQCFGCNAPLTNVSSFYPLSSIAIILIGKRESGLLPDVLRQSVALTLAVSGVGLRCVIVVFPDYTHLHFVSSRRRYIQAKFRRLVQLGASEYVFTYGICELAASTKISYVGY